MRYHPNGDGKRYYLIAGRPVSDAPGLVSHTILGPSSSHWRLKRQAKKMHVVGVVVHELGELREEA